MSSENLYHGDIPSSEAAITGAIIFLLLTALQLWRIITMRKWFGLAIVVGGLFKTLLILLAPILCAASIYMFLGRLICASGHACLSVIRINWLTKIFVRGDILCFLVQTVGAAKFDIILAGLGLQVGVFCVFALCAGVFHVRVSVSAPRFVNKVPTGLHLYAMLSSVYVCSLLATVRNVYQVVEYSQGNHGYLITHEWSTYALDVILMAVITAITLFWYVADTESKQEAGGCPLVDQGAGTSGD
ncbi:RTA1 like protein-domain-containing protein [Aspergillus pseudoustus]|uniref:RTA1 like protein-domain-containing protein n=1 Tax=Aspergillus pseudoustus TaxID=1810923 RepID=A0ABR4IWI9_9EURO